MKRIFLSFFLFIVVALLFLQFGFAPLINIIIESKINQKLKKYNTELVKGPFYLAEQYFKDIPEYELSFRMDSLAKEFGFPISLKNIQDLQISEQERQSVINGEIVIKDNWTVFYKRLGHSDHMIMLGPVKDFQDSSKDIQIIIFSIIISFMAMLSLLWVYPFWKNLKRIMTASDQLGKGVLDARADVIKGSALRPLADNFNVMAARISALVNSQKMLINAVSHEFRTPVARIRFGLEMLDSSDSQGLREKYLYGIYRDIEELESLVSELITYARLDRTRPELCVEALPAGKWLESLVLLSGSSGKGIRMDVEGVGLDEILDADPKYMGRAVTNLIANAMRHAASRIRISVKIENGTAEICVEDDGPGVPESDMERIFEPFIRLDESRNRDSGGYGLGLAIVRQIMEWHDGHVYVRRSLLGGACFCVKWPVA